MRLILNEKRTIAIPVGNVQEVRIGCSAEGAVGKLLFGENLEIREIIVNEYSMACYNSEEEAKEEFKRLIEFLELEDKKEFVVHGTVKEAFNEVVQEE